MIPELRRDLCTAGSMAKPPLLPYLLQRMEGVNGCTCDVVLFNGW